MMKLEFFTFQIKKYFNVQNINNSLFFNKPQNDCCNSTASMFLRAFIRAKPF